MVASYVFTGARSPTDEVYIQGSGVAAVEVRCYGDTFGVDQSFRSCLGEYARRGETMVEGNEIQDGFPAPPRYLLKQFGSTCRQSVPGTCFKLSSTFARVP